MPWQIRRPPERALWTFPGSGMRPLDARDAARQSVSCVSRDARNAITTLQSSANQGGRHERSRAQGRLFLRDGANTSGQAAKVLAALVGQGVNLLAFSGLP